MEDSNPKPSRTDRLIDFIDRHKVGLTATATMVFTATVVGKLKIAGYDDAMEYIEWKGLMDEFVESPQYYTHQ